jgi:hypothetical protein
LRMAAGDPEADDLDWGIWAAPLSNTYAIFGGKSRGSSP